MRRQHDPRARAERSNGHEGNGNGGEEEQPNPHFFCGGQNPTVTCICVSRLANASSLTHGARSQPSKLEININCVTVTDEDRSAYLTDQGKEQGQSNPSK